MEDGWNDDDTVCVVGGGFVGLTTALAFTHHGRKVVLVEKAPLRLQELTAGKVPFHEPGLDDALARALTAGLLQITGDPGQAVRDSRVTFLCVGTPSRSDGSIDLSFVQAAAAEVAEAVSDDPSHLIVVKSTVVPGTNQSLSDATGASFASNPEFLAEGTAYRDALEPDRIVIGTSREEDGELLESLYDGFPGDRIHVDPTTAETIKYASNSFLAARVALANEFANLCADVGVDWYTVADAIGRDPRIGSLFLRAGAGFGGSCFPKDLNAITAFAKGRGIGFGVLKVALDNNDIQPTIVVDLLADRLGGLDGRRVALLGLAFKPDTDDVRETRALPIWQALVAAGADVVCHDPMSNGTFLGLAPDASVADSINDALKDADGCIIQTEWSHYQALSPQVFLDLMARPVVVDGRRTFDPNAMREAGVDYSGIGLPNVA